MSRFMIGLIVALCCGCDALNNLKVDNPVLGPPPPRIKGTAGVSGAAGVAGVRNAAEGSGFRPSDSDPALAGRASIVRPALHQQAPGEDGGQASVTSLTVSESRSTEEAPLDDRLSGSQVVATVNGQPILASDVLDRYAPQLAAARKGLAPDEYRKARLSLIRRDLPQHIDRQLLIQKIRATLPLDSLKKIDGAIRDMFEEESSRLRKELKVNSQHELDLSLRKQGTTLDDLRDAFVMQRMAMEYLGSKSKTNEVIGHREMLQYYEAHAKDYAIPAAVKWQEISISRTSADPEKTRDQVLAELQSGASFGSVAAKHSTGPTASKEGHWDWTRKGSLSDQKLEKLLFELPVGTTSQLLVDDNEYRLVRVVDRRNEGRKDFALVQDDIRRTLETEARREASSKVLRELRETAVVTTILDEPSNREDEAAIDRRSLPFE